VNSGESRRYALVAVCCDCGQFIDLLNLKSFSGVEIDDNRNARSGKANALPLLSAACRRHDPVHAQILDHLAVMIEAMSWGKGGQEQPRGLSATT